MNATEKEVVAMNNGKKIRSVRGGLTHEQSLKNCKGSYT